MMKGKDCTYPLKGSIVRPLILSRSSVIRGTLCLPGGDELGVLNLCVGSNCKYKYIIYSRVLNIVSMECEYGM